MKNGIFLSVFSLFFVFIFIATGCAKKSHTLYEKKTSIARHKTTLKPYTVRGKKYYPRLVHVGEKQYGISSWYGPNFDGKATSNGETYDMYGRTAAHKTLPMDTVVRVKNLENGKSTVVRINDRGPFVSGRIIDCSYKAGKEIGLDKMGIAKVEVIVLDVSNKSYKAKRLISKRDKYSNLDEHIGMQMGVYSTLNRAKIASHKYKEKYTRYKPLIKKMMHKNNLLYHVWLVGFKNQNELGAFKQRQHSLSERI